jgi:hypothetical protein
MMKVVVIAVGVVWVLAGGVGARAQIEVSEDERQIRLVTPQLEAAVNKKGYVTGIAAGSLLDKKSGFRDPGYGLDIVDWIMEAGSDEAYRDKLEPELVYRFNNAYHGKTPKRSIEGPQICTQAKELTPKVVKGADFVAVKMDFKYRTAAPGKKAGSVWDQVLVFPAGERFFISHDRMTVVNSSDEMFFRLDMPGHIKHKEGDTFSEIYLSYGEKNRIPAAEFARDFAPDEKFNYRRDRDRLPQRFIRAYRLKDASGKDGPFLAGMTLDPEMVYEAWCHQRGYVCMIEEIGGKKVKEGESFGAAFIVGYFDSVEEMERVYDKYKGFRSIEVSETGWKLVR